MKRIFQGVGMGLISSTKDFSGYAFSILLCHDQSKGVLKGWCHMGWGQLPLKISKFKGTWSIFMHLSGPQPEVFVKASISPFYKIQIPFCRFTIFRVFPFSIKNSKQTDQNLPFFWIRRLKFENLGNFCCVLETLRQVKTNKMAARQTFPHTGEPKRAFKLQKYDPKRQIKQHFEGKVGKR